MRKFMISLFALLFLVAVLPEAEAASGNEYTVVGLGEYVADNARFTVEVKGTEPVCSMHMGLQTIESAPWEFIYPVDDFFFNIDVKLCRGGYDFIPIKRKVAWWISVQNSNISGEREKTLRFSVGGDIPESSAVTLIYPNGKVQKLGRIEATKYNIFTVKLKEKALLSQYVVQVASEQSSLSMRFPVLVRNKWALLEEESFYGAPERQTTYPLCATVRWYYDSTLAPGSASAARIRRDISAALARVGAVTGLTYVEVLTPDFAEGNWLTFDWDWKKSSYPSAVAVGGPSGPDGGVVHFSPRQIMRLNSRGGFGRTSAGVGTGWVIVHEVLHTLGLGHVSSRDQVMYPNIRVTKLGDGDLFALKYLYRPETCAK